MSSFEPKTRNNQMLVISAISFGVSLFMFVFFLGNNGAQAAELEGVGYNTDQVIVEVNNRREEQELDELVRDQKLMEAAQAKADHMAENGYFSHVHMDSGKKWSDFILEENYQYVIAGENLANGFETVEEMVDAWMESPSHHENIINPNVDETGVGIAVGELNGTETIFVVQTFGKEE